MWNLGHISYNSVSYYARPPSSMGFHCLYYKSNTLPLALTLSSTSEKVTPYSVLVRPLMHHCPPYIQ